VQWDSTKHAVYRCDCRSLHRYGFQYHAVTHKMKITHVVTGHLIMGIRQKKYMLYTTRCSMHLLTINAHCKVDNWQILHMVIWSTYALLCSLTAPFSATHKNHSVRHYGFGPRKNTDHWISGHGKPVFLPRILATKPQD